MSKKGSYSMLGILVLVGLYACSTYNYLLFHSIAEIFSVVVAGAIFVIAWNTRQFLSNNYLLFLGIAYLYVGGFDLLHTLSFKGIAVFEGYRKDLGTQLWVAARYVESLSLLTAFLFLRRKFKVEWVFVGYTIVCGLLLTSIFYWRIFPVCYVEGVGLTPFKDISEYIISFFLLVSAVLVLIRRKDFDEGVLRWILSSIGFTIASELSFTFYVDPYGLSNLLGHYFKILSFWCIYKALIDTGLKKPYALIFRELKESEEQYRSLFRNMINGFSRHKVLFDEEGKPVDYIFLQVNQAFEKFTGLREADVIGKTVTEVLPGISTDSTDWIGIYGRVAMTGEPAHMEKYAGPLKRWYSVSAYSPEKDHFVTVFEDITDRKRAEKALQADKDELEIRVRERTAELSRAKELLQTIIDYIPVMICLFDPDGEVKVLNSHYRNLIGWGPEKNENSDMSETCRPDSDICAEVWSHMERRESGWRDFVVRTKQGKDLETSWANVSLSDGSLIAIGIDNTERKRAEERDRLYLEQVERSNKELQDFAFVASHDLQEPLRKIQSFGDLLVTEFKDSFSEEGRDFLVRMQDAAARMRVLIDSLLTYSRLTSKVRPFFQVELNEAADEALGNLAVLKEETNGSVEVGKLPTVEGDKVQMIQLFQNLIANALKFHKKGEPPKVRISAGPIRGVGFDNVEAYEIRVEDDGIGFEEIYLSRIFAPFQRLHGKSEYEGVGIGLAICRKIVERHQGTITATSEPGKGAVFVVTLPAKKKQKMREKELLAVSG